jgi:hypothetical protein
LKVETPTWSCGRPLLMLHVSARLRHRDFGLLSAARACAMLMVHEGFRPDPVMGPCSCRYKGPFLFFVHAALSLNKKADTRRAIVFSVGLS